MIVRVKIEHLDKLAKLTDQLYAGMAIATEGEFFKIFSEDIRNNFMWILSDLTDELQATIKFIDTGREAA